MWGPPGVMAHENVPFVHEIGPPNQNTSPAKTPALRRMAGLCGPWKPTTRHFFQTEKGGAGILNVKALYLEYPVSPF